MILALRFGSGPLQFCETCWSIAAPAAERHARSGSQGRHGSKPKLENWNRTQDLLQTQVCSKPIPEKWIWRCGEIVTFVPSSRKIVTFFEVLKKTFFETWQHYTEPGMWHFVTKIWRHIFSSPSLTQSQVKVLGKLRLAMTLSVCLALRVEFLLKTDGLRVECLLKTDSGYPRDAEVTLFHPGKPWEFPSL